MRAVVQHGYGSLDALAIADVPVPAPLEGELLVRVHAASLHADIWHAVTGRPYVMRLMGPGLRRPKVTTPGIDLAGLVDSVGPGVTTFAPGDAVFGECVRGIQWKNGGAFAEYAAVLASDMAPKPTALSCTKAAAVPTSGLIAMQVVRDEGDVGPGQQVLVNGAGGAVGSFAVQIAKASGATVTAVDSANKLAALRAIGADAVIDCGATDYTATGDLFDVVIDIPGNKSLADNRRALAPDGRYVLVGHDQYGRRGHPVIGSIGRFARMWAMSMVVPQFRAPGKVSPRSERLTALAEMCDAGEITPLVDSTYPLDQIHEALRHLADGTAIGKIVITMAGAD